MSGSEAGKGLNLWPKLLLMGAVILVAFLYLRSVDRSGTEAQKPGIIEPAAELSETSEAHVALPMQTGIEADVSVTGGGTPQGTNAEGTTNMDSTDQTNAEVIVDSDQPLLQATESATDSAVEGALLTPESPGTTAVSASKRPVTETPLAAEEDKAEKVRPEARMAISDSVIGDDETEQGSQAEEVDAIPVLPAGSQVNAGGFGPGPLPPPVAVPAVSAPPVDEPMTFPTQNPAGETLEAERARVMSEYKAMRKRAEEEMRRRWDRGRIPGPYGYPRYAPGNYPPPR